MRGSAGSAALLLLVALIVVCYGSSFAGAAVSGAVKVDFYVMSKCPDAQFCEGVFGDTINSLLPIIDLNMNYIARQLIPGNITCPHGPTECIGDQQQLCAQLLSDPISGTAQWFNFSTCQSATRTSIPDNADACAAKVGLDMKALNECVSSVGPNLLYYSAQRSVAAKQGVSCTLTLNGVQWCQHDSTWKNCTEGEDGASLVKAVCKRWAGANVPDVCQKALQEESIVRPFHGLKKLLPRK